MKITETVINYCNSEVGGSCSNCFARERECIEALLRAYDQVEFIAEQEVV